MVMEETGKFVVGDMVTADGYKAGRVTKSQYKSAQAMQYERVKARLAGEVRERGWFYQIRGGGFPEDRWFKESTLKFADY